MIQILVLIGKVTCQCLLLVLPLCISPVVPTVTCLIVTFVIIYLLLDDTLALILLLIPSAEYQLINPAGVN